MQKQHAYHDNFTYEKNALLESITIACVILGFHDGKLKVLLNKYRFCNPWILPGGFVLQDEDVDEAADRVMKVNTRLDKVYLKQFHLFGKRGRTNSDESGDLLKNFGFEDRDNHWYRKRSIKMGYYALVKYEDVVLDGDKLVEKSAWFAIDEVPQLYADHNEIIKKAVESIKIQLGYVPIGYELLPPKFTMPELRMLYEAVIGRELDRRNFQRKMLSIGLIYKLEEKRKKGAHKSPYLYSFNADRYRELLEQGIPLMSWNLQ